VPNVLIQHYYYDNYNTPPCPLCYYYTTNTDNYNTPPSPPYYYYTTPTDNYNTPP